MSKSIFLLYSIKDKTGAEKIATSLREAQISIKLGSHLPDADANLDVITPFLTTNALNDSKFCSNVENALKSTKPIVTIVYEQGSLVNAAKNVQINKLLNLEYVEIEKDGLNNAIAKYVRSVNRGLSSEQPASRVDVRLENYLRRLQARIGFLNLSQVDRNQEKVQLEQIYVPLMVDWSLSIRVQNYKIVDWWIINQKSVESYQDESTQKLNRIPLKDDAEFTSIELLLKDVQQAIDNGIDNKYDDPTKRPLVLAPPWYDGVREGFWPIQAAHAAATFKRLVILGSPGSGKSTFVRFLSLCLLGSTIQPELQNVNIRLLSNWSHGPLIPLFIELRQFVGWDGFPSLDKPVNEDHFWNYIKEKLLVMDMADIVPVLKSEFLSGRGIFIFDGLDEVPIPEGKKALDRRRQQLKELARELSTIYIKSRIIFTSRDYAYRDWELDGFTSVKLATLNLSQMNNLATNLYQKKGFEPSLAQGKAQKLLLSLNQVPATLKDYPLFLTLMATLFLRGEKEGLPTKKGDLYYQSIMLLLDRWTQSGSNEPSLAEQLGCGVEKLFERLEVVAFKTHKESTATSETPSKISRALLLDELFEIGGQEDIAISKLLSFVSEQAGVLVSPEARVFQFAHRGFQEYLAASYMYRVIEDEYQKPGIEDDYKIVRDLIEEQPQLWREPCLLLGEVIVQRDKKDRLWDLVYALLVDEQLPSQISIESPRWWSIWLASRIMLDHELYLGRVQKYRSVYDELRSGIKELLNRGEALPTYEKVDTATLLGFMGDDRHGVGLKEGRPDILWCPIEEGEFTMGTTPEQIGIIQKEQWAKGWTFTRETPYNIVELPRYEISRYPITQAQFQVFTEDKVNGYLNRKWWTKSGWDWMQRKGGPFIADVILNPNLPCTNVSWYEAMAFCSWFSETMNCKVSLPTEAQWEKAAKGTNGRIFPWGNEFRDNLCNSSLSGFDSTVPVGCYKLAKNPWGLDGPSEMCGNIWQWCTSLYETDNGTIYKYPYVHDDGREDLKVGDDCYRIVRGGSFLNPPFLLRASYRGRDRPFNRAKRVGFRVVKL